MPGENTEYLVRGAQLACSCGSHVRRLNLPLSYGTYIKGHPAVTKADATEQNIKFFGVCFSETPPEGAETKRFEGGKDENGQDAESVVGPKCCPKLTTGEWQEPYGNSITMDSYVVCSCGGLIRPISSGQEFEG